MGTVWKTEIDNTYSARSFLENYKKKKYLFFDIDSFQK